MPISIVKMRDEIEAALAPLPAGWSITVDYVTDNLLVANDKIGFCITRNAILDNVWQTQAPLALAFASSLSDDQVQDILTGKTPHVRAPGATVQSRQRLRNEVE